MTDISIPDASPRDREVQHVVRQLIEVYAFREAHAILGRRLRDIADTQQTRIEELFLEWRELPPEERGEFLTYAHHRRNPELGAS